MSKGKNKRKRDRSHQKAEQQTNEVGIPNRKVIPPKKQPEAPKQGDADGGKRKEKPVGLRETIKHSSFTDWCIAAFTLILTVVAIYQGVITAGQLDTMRKDQRPWLKFLNTEVNISENASVLGAVKLVNSGKTPAKNVSVNIAVEKRERNENPTLAYPERHMLISLGALYPGAEGDDPIPFGILQEGSQTLEFEPISKEDLRKFGDGEIYYVTFAKVTYDDFFGVHHWTQFCRWTSAKLNNGPSRAFNAKQCAQYNEVDDN